MRLETMFERLAETEHRQHPTGNAVFDDSILGIVANETVSKSAEHIRQDTRPPSPAIAALAHGLELEHAMRNEVEKTANDSNDANAVFADVFAPLTILNS